MTSGVLSSGSRATILKIACVRPPGSVSTSRCAGVLEPPSVSISPTPSGCHAAPLAVDHHVAVAHCMRSPGRPITRLTQTCERSPGQRNTTTSPRCGSAPKIRGDARQFEDRGQRGGAVAIGIFGRQQLVADQQRRLHRAGRHVERLGDRVFRRQHDQHDDGDVDDALGPAAQARLLGHVVLLMRCRRR